MSMIHEITSGATRNRKRTRKGRGRSAGEGKTAGRGTKGAKARVGKYVKRGHEHGQMPIFRRLPKRGFSNFEFERRYHIVNVQDLQQFDDGSIIDSNTLYEAGLIKDTALPVKILGEGAISKKLTIQAGKYSRSAFDLITRSGGQANNAKGETYEFPKVKKKFVPREGTGKAGGKKAKAAEAAQASEGDSASAETTSE